MDQKKIGEFIAKCRKEKNLTQQELADKLNITENYCIKNDGTVVAGSFWKPGENEFSIPRNSAVTRAFSSIGWGWGGNWSSKKDYMHFSYNGG